MVPRPHFETDKARSASCLSFAIGESGLSRYPARWSCAYGAGQHDARASAVAATFYVW